MRKTFVAALVTLLVMLAVSCDNIPTGQNGDGLVSLQIKSDRSIGLPTDGTTDNSRSLTSANAKPKAAWVEVIFQDTDTSATERYYREAGAYSEPLELKVKVKKDKTYNAIILIGRNDGTLLATGKPATSVNVTADAPVTFQVNPLKSNISAVTASAVPSDFSIDATSAWANTVDTTAAAKFENGPGSLQPCFLAPVANGIKASLTIHGFNTFNSIAGTGTDIIVTDDPTVTFTPLGTAPAIATPTFTYPASIPVAIGINGKLDFTFNTTGAGQYKITVDIPVRGFDAAKTTHLEWHIRGGITSGLDFTGTGTENAIALLVTDEDPTMSTLTVGTPTWQP